MSTHAPSLNSSSRRYNVASLFTPDTDIQSQIQPFNISTSSSIPTFTQSITEKPSTSQKFYNRVLQPVAHRIRQSPQVFSNFDVSRGKYFGLRERDKRDASGKKYRVQVPHKILMWVIIIFFVLPACTFIYIVGVHEDLAEIHSESKSKDISKEQDHNLVVAEQKDEHEILSTNENAATSSGISIEDGDNQSRNENILNSGTKEESLQNATNIHVSKGLENKRQNSTSVELSQSVGNLQREEQQ